MECSLVQSPSHTKTCLLGDLKQRVVLILARLLVAISTFALYGRDTPPTSTNEIQGYITCKGPLEGELSTPPLVHMEYSTP
jgi:hypothetical protein